MFPSSPETDLAYSAGNTPYNALKHLEKYEGELNPETKARIDELKKTDPKAADELYKSVSYHVDHGNGLDCYKVGPTLGGGTAALMVNDTIIYPYCYKTFEIEEEVIHVIPFLLFSIH